MVLGPLDVVRADGAGHFENGVDGLPVVGTSGFDDDVGDEYVVDLAFGDDAVFLGSGDGFAEGGSGVPSSCQQYASTSEVELVVGDVEDALAGPLVVVVAQQGSEAVCYDGYPLVQRVAEGLEPSVGCELLLDEAVYVGGEVDQELWQAEQLFRQQPAADVLAEGGVLV